MITKAELIAFESEVAEHFNAGRIRAPVHLNGGSEDQLLEVFSRVKPHDYVFATWRSHYHALLHGVPRDEVMAKVLRGESITLQFPERRFFTSAICGGVAPIAMGVAWAEKRKASLVGNHFEMSKAHVWCFVGDMAAEQGSFSEAQRYAANHDLPLTFVIEDNQKCVNTPTHEVWGRPPSWFNERESRPNVIRYQYTLTWPHMGTGRFVTFPDGNGPKHGGM